MGDAMGCNFGSDVLQMAELLLTREMMKMACAC